MPIPKPFAISLRRPALLVAALLSAGWARAEPPLAAPAVAVPMLSMQQAAPMHERVAVLHTPSASASVAAAAHDAGTAAAVSAAVYPAAGVGPGAVQPAPAAQAGLPAAYIAPAASVTPPVAPIATAALPAPVSLPAVAPKIEPALPAEALPHGEPRVGLAGASALNRIADAMTLPSLSRALDELRVWQRGVASWYGRAFHGRRTASGERYDMHAMTAAHPTLPMSSYVRVRNVRNDRTVVVRVNDRGPFHGGRVIDLSYAAAQHLGVLGTAAVEIHRLTDAEVAAEHRTRR